LRIYITWALSLSQGRQFLDHERKLQFVEMAASLIHSPSANWRGNHGTLFNFCSKDT